MSEPDWDSDLGDVRYDDPFPGVDHNKLGATCSTPGWERTIQGKWRCHLLDGSYVDLATNDFVVPDDKMTPEETRMAYVEDVLVRTRWEIAHALEGRTK